MKKGTQQVAESTSNYNNKERYTVSKYGVLFVKDLERGEIRTLSHADIMKLGYSDISRYEAACAALLIAFGKARATVAAERGQLPKSRRAINAERVSEGLMKRYNGLMSGTMLGYMQLMRDYKKPR